MEAVKTNSVYDKLHAKMLKEYNAYIGSLKTMGFEDVVKASHRTSTYNEIMFTIAEERIDMRHAESLILSSYPLLECYDEWLGYDTSEAQDMIDCITDRAITIKEEEMSKPRKHVSIITNSQTRDQDIGMML